MTARGGWYRDPGHRGWRLGFFNQRRDAVAKRRARGTVAVGFSSLETWININYETVFAVKSDKTAMRSFYE